MRLYTETIIRTQAPNPRLTSLAFDRDQTSFGPSVVVNKIISD